MTAATVEAEGEVIATGPYQRPRHHPGLKSDGIAAAHFIRGRVPPGTFVDIRALTTGTWLRALAIPGLGHGLLEGMMFPSRRWQLGPACARWWCAPTCTAVAWATRRRPRRRGFSLPTLTIRPSSPRTDRRRVTGWVTALPGTM